MSFLVEDETILKKYNDKKIVKRKKFNCDLVYGEKYLKTKIKPCSRTITANFRNVENNSNRPSKEGFSCICWPLIMIDSVFKLGKSFYPQTFLEECKYKMKEKEIKSFIEDDLENSSDDESEQEENSE